MVKESVQNPTMMENKILTSNNSNGLEHTNSQFCKNLKTIRVPKDARRYNFPTPVNCGHDTIVCTLT